MAEPKETSFRDRSPEEIALRLFEQIAHIEQKKLFHSGDGRSATRNWILQTYSQCLKAVKDPDHFLRQRSQEAQQQDDTSA